MKSFVSFENYDTKTKELLQYYNYSSFSIMHFVSKLKSWFSKLFKYSS